MVWSSWWNPTSDHRLTSQGPRANPITPELFPTPALYVVGATSISATPFTISPGQAPVFESAQPFARVINNTIYGDDGSEAAPANVPLLGEQDDFLATANVTKVGTSVRTPFRQDAILGDNGDPLPQAADVDFYRVHLDVGDRLIADVDTLGRGLASWDP